MPLLSSCTFWLHMEWRLNKRQLPVTVLVCEYIVSYNCPRKYIIHSYTSYDITTRINCVLGAHVAGFVGKHFDGKIDAIYGMYQLLWCKAIFIEKFNFNHSISKYRIRSGWTWIYSTKRLWYKWTARFNWCKIRAMHLHNSIHAGHSNRLRTREFHNKWWNDPTR